MEQYKKIIIRNFKEHLVPDACGKRIQLYQFDATPFQPQDFKLIFSIKTTHYSFIDREIIVEPKASDNLNETGNISHYKIIEVPINRNLYIQVEKLTPAAKAVLPMDIRYQVY